MHPHIIPVYESGEVDGTPYYTMRLADGGSLADVLLKKGALEQKEAASIMVDVARAVQHAHDRGVLHRDLKPAPYLPLRRYESHWSPNIFAAPLPI